MPNADPVPVCFRPRGGQVINEILESSDMRRLLEDKEGGVQVQVVRREGRFYKTANQCYVIVVSGAEQVVQAMAEKVRLILKYLDCKIRKNEIVDRKVLAASAS